MSTSSKLFALLIFSTATTPARELTVATWNLEWLVAPATAHSSRQACSLAKRAILPCDVARDNARDSADLARLASYERELDADVVAFQEVENISIAQRVFAGRKICIAGGAGVQHVGFAIRTSIAHRCEADFTALALSSRHRRGAVLTIAPDTQQEIHLLAVHLKSGCATQSLDSGTAACEVLAGQVEPLASWVATQQEKGHRFIVLGDFNRVGPAENDLFWQQLQTGGSKPALFNAAVGKQFHNCFLGQPYSQFIDHILISNSLAGELVADSFEKRRFRSLDAFRYRLSDHCPVLVKLRLRPI
jgi:endonuclease/exonuclease/phosphatase family metal-dependent hydrolase